MDNKSCTRCNKEKIIKISTTNIANVKFVIAIDVLNVRDKISNQKIYNMKKMAIKFYRNKMIDI